MQGPEGATGEGASVPLPWSPVSYVQHMRAFVGQQPLLLPAVTVLVTDDDGRILLVVQRDRQEWSTVGGSMEPGESPVEACVREAAEETGLTIEVGELVGVVGGAEYAIEYPNGDVCVYVSSVFRARVIGGELVPDGDEVVECRWVAPQDIAALGLAPFTRRLLTEVGVLS